MKRIPFWRRYARLLGPDPAADVKDELRFHLEAKTDELVRLGWPPDDARREAERRFGDVRAVQHIGEKLGEKMERRRRFNDYLVECDRDVRYTLRNLRNNPGFAAVAILVLALGIGVNVAVFSVVNTLLLRPLPFPDSRQLVWIAPPPTKCGQSCATYSTDGYDTFRAGTRSFQDVTGYNAFSTPDNLSLSIGSGAPIQATSIDVITNFFNCSACSPPWVAPLLRTTAATAPAAVLLSDAWWRRQFNADPAIVGKAFDMNGRQTTVIGVLPKSFDFGAVFSPGTKVDAITPVDLYGPVRNQGNNFTFVGRIKPGVSLAQAQQDAAAVAPHMCNNNKYADSCGHYEAVPVPLKDYVSGKLRRSLVVLWSAVGGILLIACVNLSNLLLARAASRSREFAMRAALGATRSRIVRQLLTESLILSAAGAIGGLALAAILLAWLRVQGAIALPLLGALRIDGAALGWTVLIAVFAAVLFGLVPGLRMAWGNLQESLKDSGLAPGEGANTSVSAPRSSSPKSLWPAYYSSAPDCCCAASSKSSTLTRIRAATRRCRHSRFRRHLSHPPRRPPGTNSNPPSGTQPRQLNSRRPGRGYRRLPATWPESRMGCALSQRLQSPR